MEKQCKSKNVGVNSKVYDLKLPKRKYTMLTEAKRIPGRSPIGNSIQKAKEVVAVSFVDNAQSPSVKEPAQPIAGDIQHGNIVGDVPVTGGGPPQPHGAEPLPRDPLGRSFNLDVLVTKLENNFNRWLVAMESDKVGSQCLRGYMDQLDNLKSSKFIWQPYDLASLPEYCLTGRHIWMTRSPLICFERVEWHFPDRVCPQYNLSRVIPRDCDTGGEVLHKIDRRGHPNTNWELKHRFYVDMWNTRAESIYAREDAGEYVDAGYFSQYMLWYRSITRLLVDKLVQSRPFGYQGGHAIIEMLAQQIKRLYHLADTTDPNAAIETLASVKFVCREALSAIGEAKRISADALPEPQIQDLIQGLLQLTLQMVIGGKFRHIKAT
ncbi:hypothetical protein RJ639_002211 [Escallonia herrerae]|uniref:Aminotransferase-like plant mobile domain-containing protein n=1 Tax=Escallonia herrerae TaxID=1293975 RepID=A0AA88XMJ6_9ASTE|nr:hypothetical protein RJ639_002211 [Escallonia herrerae]